MEINYWNKLGSFKQVLGGPLVVVVGGGRVVGGGWVVCGRFE